MPQRRDFRAVAPIQDARMWYRFDSLCFLGVFIDDLSSTPETFGGATTFMVVTKENHNVTPQITVEQLPHRVCKKTP